MRRRNSQSHKGRCQTAVHRDRELSKDDLGVIPEL